MVNRFLIARYWVAEVVAAQQVNAIGLRMLAGRLAPHRLVGICSLLIVGDPFAIGSFAIELQRTTSSQFVDAGRAVPAAPLRSPLLYQPRDQRMQYNVLRPRSNNDFPATAAEDQN